MKNFRFSGLIFATVLIFPLVLFTTNTIYGGPNPPTGEDHPAGPAIIGTFTFYPATCIDELGQYECIAVEFSGKCKGQPIGFSAEAVPDLLYSDVTRDNLKWYRPPIPAPPGCYSDSGGEQVIIIAVNGFDEISEPENERMKEANVVIFSLVGRGR